MERTCAAFVLAQQDHPFVTEQVFDAVVDIEPLNRFFAQSLNGELFQLFALEQN
jgi:hypothetical protein